MVNADRRGCTILTSNNESRAGREYLKRGFPSKQRLWQRKRHQQERSSRKEGEHSRHGAKRVVALSSITPNKGQIPGVPKNPRSIQDGKFSLLKRSIEEDPEMLGLREILLYKYNGKNIIIGGNMRYRALKELGYTEAIVKFARKHAA